jgi:hypothetical protein
MGAWSFEVLTNDSALDAMWNLKDSKDVKSDVEKLLDDGDVEEKVLACEIVDISINGINEEILGGLYKYEEFFRSIQNEPITELRLKAFETIRYIQKHDNGWVDEVKEQRANLLRRIENRLTSQ